MVSTLNKDDLRQLLEFHSGPCVSIFVDTAMAGNTVQQNQIRFKNLVREANRKLQERGMRPGEIDALLDPTGQFTRDNMFWQHQGEGLAFFIAPNYVRWFYLPFDVKDEVTVSERFSVRPLMPMLTGDGKFYILAISGKRNRVLECSRHHVHEIQLSGLPDDMQDAVKYDEPDKTMRPHGTSPRPGVRNSTTWGHGGGDDPAKYDYRGYMQVVHGALRERLKHQPNVPLIVAAVDFLHAHWRDVNTHPTLVEPGIMGNPDGLSDKELHELALPKIIPYLEAEQQEALRQFQEFVGVGRASTSLQEVLPAAFHGRVEVLFVPEGEHRWGKVDPDKNQVEVHNQPQPGDDDLVDVAAVQTFLNSGTVYVVDGSLLQGDAPMAAVFRY